MNTAIANEADLSSVAATLHDARFTVDTIDYNAAAHTFTLKCWVREPGRKDSGKARAWMALRLSFEKVDECKITIKENVAYCELATLIYEAQDSRLELITHYGVQMCLRLEKLEGTLTETNEMCEQWPAK